MRLLLLLCFPLIILCNPVPNFYYKSWQECTNSDSRTAIKCPVNSTFQCGEQGNIASLYCTTAQDSCQNIASKVTPQQPDGFGFMCPHLMLGSAELLNASQSDNYTGAYAVVTFDNLKCGECMEIYNTDTYI